MPDLFLGGDVVFKDANKAKEFSSQIEHVKKEIVFCDVDGCYVSLDGESSHENELNLQVIAEMAEQHGAIGLLLTLRDESGQDEETLCRKNGKKARPSTIEKLVERVAPAYPAYYLINEGELDKLADKLKKGLNASGVAYKQPLLMVAIQSNSNRIELVKLLLSYGASPNEQGSNIAWEAGGGNEKPDIVSILFDLVAIRRPNTSRIAEVNEILKLLLAAGANPNDAGPAAEASVLSAAIYTGNQEAVELLIEAGADPNAVYGKIMAPPLSVAVERYIEAAKDELDTAPAKAIVKRLMELDHNHELVDFEGKILGHLSKVLPEAVDW